MWFIHCANNSTWLLAYLYPEGEPDFDSLDAFGAEHVVRDELHAEGAEETDGVIN